MRFSIKKGEFCEYDTAFSSVSPKREIFAEKAINYKPSIIIVGSKKENIFQKPIAIALTWCYNKEVKLQRRKERLKNGKRR